MSQQRAQTKTSTLAKSAKAKPSAEYTAWIAGRRAQHLSTNSGSDSIAFQDWRRFKEAFAPELVCQAVLETSDALGRNVQSCLDPFSGSGTTPLTCQFLGVLPYAIELSPFLADLTDAKLASYDIAKLVDITSGITASYKSRSRGHAKEIFGNDVPRTFFAPGVNGRYLFSKALAERLAQLRIRIQRVQDSKIRRLLRVLLASVAIEVSNATVSGKGRRYRRAWEDRQSTPADLDALFETAIQKAVFDIRRHERRPMRVYELVRGDTRQAISTGAAVDLAVFSPPYPNSFDYTDVYNVELWIGGYLRNAAQNRALREATLRSHVQILRDFSWANEQPAQLKRILRALDDARDELWNPHIPSMVGAYFDDMSAILRALSRRVIKRGRVYMVVGDSRYAGVTVPVASILVKIAESLGFDVVGLEPFRSMRSSPQQGGQHNLPETLITLSRS